VGTAFLRKQFANWIVFHILTTGAKGQDDQTDSDLCKLFLDNAKRKLWVQPEIGGTSLHSYLQQQLYSLEPTQVVVKLVIPHATHARWHLSGVHTGRVPHTTAKYIKEQQSESNRADM
jgi:hypothetical protein